MSLVLAWCLKHWRFLLTIAFWLACMAAIAYKAYGDGVEAGAAQVAKMQDERDNERVRFALEHAKAMEERAQRYQTRAEAMSATATQYQEALKDAHRKHDRTVADLRSGALQLRRQWQGCEARVSEAGHAASGGREPDADAELRAADSGNLVRAGAQCDAWISKLQQTLRDERQ